MKYNTVLLIILLLVITTVQPIINFRQIIDFQELYKKNSKDIINSVKLAVPRFGYSIIVAPLIRKRCPSGQRIGRHGRCRLIW
uniref:Putative secreted protein n=1 Tax=Triatoma infestans TaxID=30076 RepID=A0A023EYX9_TRIIF